MMPSRASCLLLIVSTAGCVRALPNGPYVAELDLRGVHNVNARTLREGLACKPAPRRRRAAAQPFDELDLARDRLRIERYYESKGYYAARVTLAEARPREKGGLDVVIAVEEGPPTLIGDVRVFGSADLDDATKEKIRAAQLGLRRGQVFVHADYLRFKDGLVRVLRQNGYPNASIEGVVDVLPDDNLAQVHLTLRAGAPASMPEERP